MGTRPKMDVAGNVLPCHTMARHPSQSLRSELASLVFAMAIAKEDSDISMAGLMEQRRDDTAVIITLCLSVVLSRI